MRAEPAIKQEAAEWLRADAASCGGVSSFRMASEGLVSFELDLSPPSVLLRPDVSLQTVWTAAPV
ncbi:hypothetical protein EYF80_063486 [Liparis tanakae]|uniref:Uncharacterized protein n=1 Tax=Liparis tanakae TaxID=230148 RepID=A0A4Z2EBW8_9TELE|nr:hypothetical protein EYF80_063486 [Liparis tanakae]